MRSLSRPALTASAATTLASMQSAVNTAPVPAKKADALWKAKRSKSRRSAFDDVRSALEGMAGLTYRCVYCEDSRGTDVDHFRPKSIYPGFSFVWENYFLACSHCNSNEKRVHFPLDAAGAPLLIDPVADDPFKHLVFVPTTGYLIGITDKGTETEKVFGLNRRDELTHGRRGTWQSAMSLLVDLERALRPTPLASYDEIVRTIRQLPFQAVVFHLLREAVRKNSTVRKDVSSIVKRTRTEWQGHYL